MIKHLKYKLLNTIAFNCILVLLLTLSSCSSNDNDSHNQSNYIPNVSFDTGNRINTRLPQYNNLNFANNFIVLNDFGINGIVLFYAGNDIYSAFELTDPNHAIQNCSKLTVTDIIAKCSCEGNSYEILSGRPQQGASGQNPLKRYRVEVNGSIIRVFN